MRCAAKQDESREEPQQRPKDEIRAAMRKHGQRQGNAEIGDTNARVGQRIGPDQPRLPKQAEPMRREPAESNSHW